MTSKEALEELKDEIIPDYALEYEDDEGYKDWVIELYNTIKQDLENYERLKQTHDKTLINNGELVIKVCNLEKENQALRKGIDLDLNAKLLSENEKLKKAIEILKMQVDGCTISEQEDKLLSEVLKC